MLFWFAANSFGQQNIDNTMIREMAKQKGYNINDADIKNYKEKTDEKKSAEPEKTDLTNKDTADVKQDIDYTASIYENIIQNRIIDPDTILKTLTIFGHDVFKNTKPSTFAPTDYIATPADYPVSSGDEIIVLLWGRINEEYRLKVDRDGKINIPRIGPVGVAGLPFSAMQKNILDRLQNIEGVQASITMGTLRTMGIYIVGEVKSPGMYTVSALSNVTNALFAAGGPAKSGSLRNIQLKRNGNVIATIDFYDFLLSGKDNASARLKSGDVILVPIVKKMVAIAGNVRRSALYEIRNNSSLKDALALAGGITPAAWTNRIQIERFKNNQYQVVLDLSPEKEQELPDFIIEDGDIIKVFPVVVKDKNAIYLDGNVMRPGKYEFKDEMRISDLLPDYQSLLPETYFDYAVIMRQNSPSFLSRIIPFNLKKAMEDHSSGDNTSLQPQDVVVVYSRDYFEPDRTVSIGGAVTTPGKQKLLENMKLRDIIIKAGGTTEEASLEKGELYRRVYNNENVSTQKIEFCVRCAMQDDPKHNLELRKFDMIYIRNKKGWEEEKKVVLKGEVVYPGEYVLFSGETLGNLIDRAGGFTNDVFLPAAILTRTSVSTLERKRMEEYIARLQSDAMKFSTELVSKQQQASDVQQLLLQQQMLISQLREQVYEGRVVIDLTNPDHYRNFLLENGDSLYFPRLVGTVSVIGETFNPATFRFEGNGSRVNKYVEMAGGFRESADRKKVYVIKANGSVITKNSTRVMAYALSPGDVVVVPQKIIYKNNFKTFMDTLDSVVKIATLITSIAMLVIAVNSTNK